MDIFKCDICKSKFRETSLQETLFSEMSSLFTKDDTALIRLQRVEILLNAEKVAFKATGKEYLIIIRKQSEDKTGFYLGEYNLGGQPDGHRRGFMNSKNSILIYDFKN
jgi:hypothetical protein